jgi:hypothetical protein
MSSWATKPVGIKQMADTTFKYFRSGLDKPQRCMALRVITLSNHRMRRCSLQLSGDWDTSAKRERPVNLCQLVTKGELRAMMMWVLGRPWIHIAGVYYRSNGASSAGGDQKESCNVWKWTTRLSKSSSIKPAASFAPCWTWKVCENQSVHSSRSNW